MKIKLILFLISTLFLIGLASASLTTATNEYKILSQIGDEEVYNIIFEDIQIDIDESWWLWEWFTDLFGDDSVTGTQICMEAEFEDEYPETLAFYKTEELIQQDNIEISELEIEDNKYKVKFCYIANPYEDYYLKFGENSVIIIQITSAEHLNSAREFIADIYDYVNESDGITYTIPDGEYVRVEFEQELNNSRRIGIEAVNTNATNSMVYIYEKDSNEIIGIGNFNQSWILINLNHSGNQSVFDFKSINNITYDWIIDPANAPGWTNNLADDPDTVNDGEVITYTATGNDNGGDASQPYKLVVCRDDNVDDDNNEACNNGMDLCQSDGANFGVEVECDYTTLVGDVGEFQVYGFLCGDDGRCTDGKSGRPGSTSETTTVNMVYGTLDVNITSPLNNSDWYYGNSNLTVNATVTCVGGSCGTITAYLRYNKTTAVPDTLINFSVGGDPFYTISIVDWLRDGDGLLSYYNFDSAVESIQGGTWNLVTNEGAPTFTTTNAKVGSSGSIAVDNNWNITDKPSMDFTHAGGNMTISGWLRPCANEVSLHILNKYQGGTGWYIQQMDTGTGYSNAIRGGYFGNPDLDSDDDVFVASTWVNFAFVKNGSSSSIWIDGKLNVTETTFVDPLTGIGNETNIGHLVGAADWCGLIDELSFWNRSLNSSELSDLYNDGSGASYDGGFNTQTKTLADGESWNVTFILNVTSSSEVSYLIDVNFTSSLLDANVPDNNTEDMQVNLNPAGGPADTEYPQFFVYWDNNATLTDSGIGFFNVTINSTNGTVYLEIDGNNVTALNMSPTNEVYNASYTFSSAGTYDYRWHSWGNGTSTNYNVSEEQSYTVNSSNCWTKTDHILLIPKGCIYEKLEGVLDGLL